jgi:hypothetical protein
MSHMACSDVAASDVCEALPRGVQLVGGARLPVGSLRVPASIQADGGGGEKRVHVCQQYKEAPGLRRPPSRDRLALRRSSEGIRGGEIDASACMGRHRAFARPPL